MSDIGSTRSKRGLSLDVAAELGDLLYDLTHDKKTRAQIGRIIKEAKPESQHAAAFKDIELEDRLADFERAREDREIQERGKAKISQLEEQRRRLLEGDESGRKYSEDDLKKIEELMNKKGIIDYEDAATLYAASVPQPGPLEEQPSGTTWEFPEWGKFSKDPVKASREVANDVIRELRRKSGRR